MYLWNNNLDEDVAQQWKVIKTLMGVRSSGNQAEFWLRRTAEFQSSIISLLMLYVDDCFSSGKHFEGVMSIDLEKGGLT